VIAPRAIEGQPMLKMTQIAKRYGASLALENANLEVARGQVMALLGENGAGKSTLMKILAGLETPDSGTIEIDGKSRRLDSPGHARAAGIGYVAQELSIVEQMSVAENVFLGDSNFGWFRAPRRLAQQARPYLETMGLSHIDPLAPTGSLSVGERQLVEIARLVSRKARIAILDEPTAALADAEIHKVETAVKALAAEGCAVIYVTHRLREVFQLCDRVTVLRNARSFPAVDIGTINVNQLIEKMLGRRLDQMFPERSGSFGEELLSLQNCLSEGLHSPVNLAVRRGEIVALAGQVGSGANTVLRIIGGLTPLASGILSLGGSKYSPASLRDAISKGVAFCSDDRKRDGIFAGRSVVENLSAPSLRRVSPLGLINSPFERRFADNIAERFELDRRHMPRATGNLSGGNQQKVALGKWVGIAPRVLLVEEPTRGVDVGARAEIYRQLRKLANDGVAIVFVSSDTQEVIGLADRVATFYHGRMVRLMEADRATPETITRDVTHPEASTASSGM
jgi:ribose transport system ATP-binding protein/rhamnose transport system ATP-binding protein